jgi:electron transport complex protein RnfC
VAIPLEDRFRKSEVLVKQGEEVALGHRLSDGARTAHASISGVVAGVRSLAVRRNTSETVVVVHGKEGAAPSGLLAEQAEQIDIPGPDFHSVLVSAGVLAPPLNGAGPGQYEAVILRGFGVEPVLVHDGLLLSSHASKAVEGLKVLTGALGARESIIAVTEDQRDLLSTMRWAAGEDARIVVLPARFPVGLPRMLRRAVSIVQGRQFSGPTFVADVNLVLAAADVARHGHPYIKKTITVGCLDTGRIGTVETPIGVRFHEIVAAAGCEAANVATIIDGGLLTGLSQVSLEQPVTKSTVGLFFTAGSAIRSYEPEPCFRCGRCVAVCPAALVPTDLERLAIKGQMMEDKDSFLACLECGTCAYECPAHRELAQWIRMGRHALLGDVPGEGE